MTREEFEREFYSRTLAYHPEYRSDNRPVVVIFDPAADTTPGHALVVSLVNQLARAHRRIVLVGAFDRPLLCADHFGSGSTLAEATAGVARAINPFIDVRLSNTAPTGERLVSLGIGTDVADLPLGADGWTATVGSGAHIDSRPTTVCGAALAACLGAAIAFHRALGDTSKPGGTFSLWDYMRSSTEQGPELHTPLDVGRVLQVGAGAVGSSLGYWTRFFELGGSWTIADGDAIEVSNLNRQIFFLAKDAGYPEGPARNKAEALAERLFPRAASSPYWYGDDSAVRSAEYDLVLPLANDYAARPALQQRAQTILLHATTSRHWQAQVHRHVAGRDGCVVCRIPERPGEVFGCAEGEIGSDRPQDASLPFLSATAGLLLFAEIVRLQFGRLVDSASNFRAAYMRTPVPWTQEADCQCLAGCRNWMKPARRLAKTTNTRFAELDGDQRTSIARSCSAQDQPST